LGWQEITLHVLGYIPILSHQKLSVVGQQKGDTNVVVTANNKRHLPVLRTAAVEIGVYWKYVVSPYQLIGRLSVRNMALGVWKRRHVKLT
jgi:hypothetical protein